MSPNRASAYITCMITRAATSGQTPLRIKEWDFYQITNERYTMQMTIGTLSYGGMSYGRVTLFDRQTGEKYECNDLALFPFDKYHLPANTDSTRTRSPIDKKNFYMSFDVTETKRILKLRGPQQKGRRL